MNKTLGSRLACAALCTMISTISAVSANAQIPSNVFERVLHLRVNAGTDHEGTATGFTIAIDGKQYLITAAHVVSGLGDAATIGIEQNDKWVDLKMKVYRCDPPVDIAVLISDQQLTVDYSLPAETGTFQVGQDAFFLGFPYGLGSPGKNLNGTYPLGLVKKGVVSGVLPPEGGKKGGVLLLDGYNNPGFSGGPVVSRDFQKAGYVFEVLAVVSGFEPEVVPVMEPLPIASPEQCSDKAKQEPWRVRRKADGTYFEYKDTGNSVALNTGIVVSYIIGPAVDLIRKHPNGPKEVPLTNQPILK